VEELVVALVFTKFITVGKDQNFIIVYTTQYPQPVHSVTLHFEIHFNGYPTNATHRFRAPSY